MRTLLSEWWEEWSDPRDRVEVLEVQNKGAASPAAGVEN